MGVGDGLTLGDGDGAGPPSSEGWVSFHQSSGGAIVPRTATATLALRPPEVHVAMPICWPSWPVGAIVSVIDAVIGVSDHVSRLSSRDSTNCASPPQGLVTVPTGVPTFATGTRCTPAARAFAPDAVFACGPLPMLRHVQQAFGADVVTQLSLEERMACGVGACYACVVPDAGDPDHQHRICWDGPVFNAQEVVL